MVLAVVELGGAAKGMPSEIQFMSFPFGKGSKLTCKAMNLEPHKTILIFLVGSLGNGIVFLGKGL